MLYHRYIQKKLLHQCIKILYFNSTFESRNNYTFTTRKILNKKKDSTSSTQLCPSSLTPDKEALKWFQ
jgi:hypothetical protein